YQLLTIECQSDFSFVSSWQSRLVSPPEGVARIRAGGARGRAEGLMTAERWRNVLAVAASLLVVAALGALFENGWFAGAAPEDERCRYLLRGALAAALVLGWVGVGLWRRGGRLGALLESMPGCFVVVDGGQIIVRVNRHAEALFGYKRSEIVGKQLRLLFP